MNKSKAPIIALFGPDGSGKSAVAGYLEKHCEAVGLKIVRMHWRPGLLPYRYRATTSRCKRYFKEPHKTKLRRGPKAWLILLYVVMDFLLGYLFLIRPKLNNGTTIVYERYYYDILIDQKRYGLCIPASVHRTVARLLPVPDTIVLLDAPAEVLRARKQELPQVEIELQRQKMKEYFYSFDNCLVVDVNHNNAEDAANIILAAVDNK